MLFQSHSSLDDCAPFDVVIDGNSSDALPYCVLSFLNAFWRELVVGFQHGSFIGNFNQS